LFDFTVVLELLTGYQQKNDSNWLIVKSYYWGKIILKFYMCILW